MESTNIQKTKIGDSVLLSLFICSYVVCEAADAPPPLSSSPQHRLKRYSVFKSTRMGSMIPKLEVVGREKYICTSWKTFKNSMDVQEEPITKTRLFIFIYIENFATKNWKFSDKKSDMFHISAQNINCGYPSEPPRRGGSNEYPQSMFLSRNKKNNVYPCKPQFYYIIVGFKGVNII